MGDQMKFELGSSTQALEHIHNAIKELHLAMTQLTAPADMTDEPKPKPVKKKPNPWHMPVKTHFIDYYKKEKGVDYYFTLKDGATINRIIEKLEFVIRGIGQVHRQDINVDMMWQNILRKLKESEPWVYENLSLTLIDNKLNEIVAKMKDGRDDYRSELLNRMS